jgi:hypothetical protein
MVEQIAHVSGPTKLSGGGSLQTIDGRPAPASVPAAQAPAPAAAGPASQDAAVAQVNQHLQQSDLKLEVDPGSNRTVFQIIQKGTGQVLLQFPSEEVLGMSRRIRALAAKEGAPGALVDKEG